MSRLLRALAFSLLVTLPAACGALTEQGITADTRCEDYLEHPLDVRQDAAIRISREIDGVSSPGNPMWALTLDAACGKSPSMTLREFFAGGSSTTVRPTTTVAPDPRLPTVPSVPTGATITGETPCPKPDGSSPRTTRFASAPPVCIDMGKRYSAEVKTSKGSFVITLDAMQAPKTVNNFVVLARYHFFDGVAFHRVVPGFVIQTGDPQGNGRGGPGYRFADELPQAAQYRIGSVVMANNGANTNGSQFFIITGEDGVKLPPRYSLFGQVTDGMNVVKAIEALGTPETAGNPNGGKPREVVTIQSMTIREG